MIKSKEVMNKIKLIISKIKCIITSNKINLNYYNYFYFM